MSGDTSNHSLVWNTRSCRGELWLRMMRWKSEQWVGNQTSRGILGGCMLWEQWEKGYYIQELHSIKIDDFFIIYLDNITNESLLQSRLCLELWFHLFELFSINRLSLYGIVWIWCRWFLWWHWHSWFSIWIPIEYFNQLWIPVVFSSLWFATTFWTVWFFGAVIWQDWFSPSD